MLMQKKYGTVQLSYAILQTAFQFPTELPLVVCNIKKKNHIIINRESS